MAVWPLPAVVAASDSSRREAQMLKMLRKNFSDGPQEALRTPLMGWVCPNRDALLGLLELALLVAWSLQRRLRRS